MFWSWTWFVGDQFRNKNHHGPGVRFSGHGSLVVVSVSVSTCSSAFEGRSWLDTVREVEGLGYSTVFVPDHFDEGLGPITAIATAAAVTSTINVGSLVLDCDFRHPAVLARELASIDVVSEGRLEVGLGPAGSGSTTTGPASRWTRPKVRVDRMIEHTAGAEGSVRRRTVHFAGEHYTITDLDGTPKPHRPAARRSSSAAALAGCCASPARSRHRGCATCRSTPARSTPRRRRTRCPNASTRRSAGSGRAPATASTTSSSTPGSRSPRSPTTAGRRRRDAGHRLRDRRRRRSCPSPLSLIGRADRDQRAPPRAPGSGGATPTRSSPATRPTTSPPSSPSSPAPEHHNERLPVAEALEPMSL